jgi:hypothetical protein
MADGANPEEVSGLLMMLADAELLNIVVDVV